MRMLGMRMLGMLMLGMLIVGMMLFGGSVARADPTTQPTRPVYGPAPREKPAEENISLVARVDQPAYVPKFAQSQQQPALQASRAYAQQFDFPVDPRVAFDPLWQWGRQCCRNWIGW